MPGVWVDMDSAKSRLGAEEPDLRSRLSNLLLTDSMSDVCFVVGEPPIRCPCHKLVLGLGSTVFEAMFYGKMAEKDEVRVPDVTREGFVTMLRYLYTDAVCLGRSASEAFETAYVAQKYLIDPLFGACETHLVRHATLDPEGVFSVLEKATFLGMGRLRGRCLRYVSRNATKVLTSESFAMSPRGTLEDILALDLMDIESEVEVIEALWRWGEERCRELDVEISGENIRNRTRDYLKHVRFLSLAKRDLEEAMGKFQLLDADEELAVLWNVAMPKSVGAKVDIPPNLCDVSRTRSVANCSRLELPTEYRYDGSLTVFSIEKQRTTVRVTVTGRPVTLLGAVLAFKPIPCYSPEHRSVDFELRVGNASTRLRSRARLFCSSSSRAESKKESVEIVDDGTRRIDEIVEDGRKISISSRAEDVVECRRGKVHGLESSKRRNRTIGDGRDEESSGRNRRIGEEVDETELLLEDFVAISDGETADLTVEMATEGVRLMRCVESEFTTRCGGALVTFRFDSVDRTLFPIKELMYVA